MPDKVDMSLDDIVKLNKNKKPTTNRGGRGTFGARSFGARRGGFAGGVQKRRSGGPTGLKTSPFKAAAKLPDGKWLHDMYGGQRGGGLRRASAGLTTGPTKIIISNLDFGVNDKDIKDLFEEFGTIKKAAVHYDRSGRSLGTADVLFEKKQDAIKAVNKYNGVQLDGRPMEIQLGTNATVAAQRSSSVPATGDLPQQQQQQQRGGFAGQNRRGGLFRRGGRGGFQRGGRGGGSAGGRQNNQQQKTTKTQAELDAELDSYTMQTD